MIDVTEEIKMKDLFITETVLNNSNDSLCISGYPFVEPSWSS